MTSPPRRALLFDLDGTLVDSAPDLAAAANAWLAELGRPQLPVAAVAGMLGDGIAALAQRLLAATGGGAYMAAYATRLSRHYAATGDERTHPYPAVKQTLDQLAEAGFALGVCTNKPHDAALRVLERVGLGRAFDAVLGGDAAPARKPDPRHALALLERLGVPSRHGILIGDGRNDVACARAAGMASVAVTWGYGPADELGADSVVEAFADLPAAVERLLG